MHTEHVELRERHVNLPIQKIILVSHTCKIKPRIIISLFKLCASKKENVYVDLLTVTPVPAGSVITNVPEQR